MQLHAVCTGAYLGFSEEGRGGGGSHPGYFHSPLQMFGPENVICNYVYLKNYLTKGEWGWGGGSRAPQDPPGYAPVAMQAS